jgi:hypothetical protein
MKIVIQRERAVSQLYLWVAIKRARNKRQPKRVTPEWVRAFENRKGKEEAVDDFSFPFFTGWCYALFC